VSQPHTCACIATARLELSTFTHSWAVLFEIR
jgi:hypothetical protein